MLFGSPPPPRPVARARARRARLSPWLSLLGVAALAGACGDKGASSGSTGSAGSATVVASASAPGPHEPLKAPERTGGPLRRSADGARLYLADEDHKSLRTLALSFSEGAGEATTAPSAAPASPDASAYPKAGASAHPSASAPAKPKPPPVQPGPGVVPPVEPPPMAKSEETPMPGAPAAVLPVDGYVLVTIRDPGLLLVMKEQPGNKLTEERRIQLAPDAWGIALSPDEKTAIVTSAWTHTVSGVDWQKGTVLYTLNVAREPRGVVIHPDGKTAYVSHLTSANLTRIDDLASASAKTSVVAFPAAPSHAPQGITLEGSLGYALAMDEDGHRLLAARHALGALGTNAWYGTPTVDVLQTQNDKPLLGPRVPDKRIKGSPAFEQAREGVLSLPDDDWRKRPFVSTDLRVGDIVQPRDLVVAKKTRSIWVASEGGDLVQELPLFAAAPAEKPLRTVYVGSHYKDPKIIGNGYADADGIAGHCGAPSGLALSADETELFVFCRSTYDIAVAHLDDPKSLKLSVLRVATDPLDEDGSRGRRLFYGGRDDYSSGGMGCAGCHPEGRDDGHVWHEVVEDDAQRNRHHFLAHQNQADKTKNGRLGYARQTPMLAGRVNASGPYGWHGQDADLTERLADGFNLHRWGGGNADAKAWMTGVRANALAVFLRKGLVTPPPLGRELTDVEKRGKTVFESDATQCTQCHVAATELTNRTAYSLKALPTLPGFEEEEDGKLKTPSLLFIRGTAPYFHDGSAPTLADLIAKNGDRMGKTSQLTDAERDALVAYLETL